MLITDLGMYTSVVRFLLFIWTLETGGHFRHSNKQPRNRDSQPHPKLIKKYRVKEQELI